MPVENENAFTCVSVGLAIFQMVKVLRAAWAIRRHERYWNFVSQLKQGREGLACETRAFRGVRMSRMR